MVNELDFKKAVKGDKESFSKLLKPIKDKLYKVAFVYMGNEDDSLDCIQESIIKAITSLKSLKEPQYFNTWIVKITVNTCKDTLRKKNKLNLVDIADYENSIITENNTLEDKHDVLAALKILNESERDLIVMRYLDDMSLNDISKNTTLPLGTVKSKISRSLKKLRVFMKEV